MRRTVSAARVQTVGSYGDPSYPLFAVGRVQARGAVGLGVGESDVEGRSTRFACGQAEPTERGRSGSNPQPGMAGRGLGRLPVVGDDDRGSPWRAVCPEV